MTIRPSNHTAIKVNVARCSDRPCVCFSADRGDSFILPLLLPAAASPGGVLESATDTIDAVFQSLGSIELPEWSATDEERPLSTKRPASGEETRVRTPTSVRYRTNYKEQKRHAS